MLKPEDIVTKASGLLTKTILGLSIFLSAQSVQSAIYRPNGSTGALISDIISANNTQDDDIIDLGGFIYIYDAPCSEDSENCPTTNGQNALPSIGNYDRAGKLSIINGTIQRDVESSNRFRFFDVLEDAYFTLFNVTLAYGYAEIFDQSMSFKDADAAAFGPNYGGAIFNLGFTTLQNSTIINNTAGESGGAIFNEGLMDIQSSNFSNNTANNISGGYGGGGAIYNDGYIIAISNSSISGNNTAGYGGGINNHEVIEFIYGTTISRNNCCLPVDGGECPDPPTGSGGGIYNDGDAEALNVFNSTIAYNNAYQGGGVYNNSNGDNDNPPPFISIYQLETWGVSFFNSTISRNIAHNGGGGIFNSNNSNSPNDFEGPAVINELVSNIIADNTDTSELLLSSPDIQNFENYPGPSGFIQNHRNNLIGNNAGAPQTFYPGNEGFDIVGTPEAIIDPQLNNLDYNGGFTATMSLKARSPAINNGYNPLKFKQDQRGKTFARVSCSRPDIGAYELKNCFAQ